jgi:chlorobactene glucosyltransferase
MVPLLLSSLILFLGAAVTHWLHSQNTIDIVVRPVQVTKGESYPLISAIVPARDEAANIRACVEALLTQTYPNFELIVVDDQSTDGTSQILGEMLQHSLADERRLHVIEGGELPADWAGKTHALQQAAEAARGEWLCFIDADTFAAADLLLSTYESAKNLEADMFSIFTNQELGSFWEKVLLPVVFTALAVGFPARRVNDPRLPDAIANGQFILIRDTVYRAIGGHATIKARIDEDKALAETVKKSGYRLVVADGRTLARTRMYTSLPEMWEGWTKNIYVGMRDRLGLLLFGAVLGLICALLLPAWLLSGLVWFIFSGGWQAAFIMAEALLLWGYLLIMRALAARAFNISGIYAFSLPLGAFVFTAMMFASTFKVLSGKGVTWKGRLYLP